MAGKRKKKDKFSIGFAAGLGMPVLIFAAIYYVRYPNVAFSTYISELWQFDILLKIMSLCVFPNLLFFLLYIRKKMDFAAKGVLGATIIYAFIVLASKII